MTQSGSSPNPPNAPSTLEVLKRATDAVSRALAVLPQDHLLAAVERGFTLWPQPGAPFPDFLIPVLQTLVEESKAAVNAEIAAIGIGRSPSVPFHPWVVSENAKGYFEKMKRAPRPVGVLGLTATGGKTLRIPNVREHAAFGGTPEGHPPVSSFMGVPILFRETSLGNLYVANKLGADEFTDEDQRTLEILATHAAAALQQGCFQVAAKSQQGQLQAILESVPSGIIFVDSTYRWVIGNARAMALFGIPITGPRKNFSDLLRTPEGFPVPEEALPSERAIRGVEPKRGEFIILRRDGARTPILIHAAPVPGLEGKVLGAVLIIEDISREKELARLQDEFLALVVHDLRNPLQAILTQAALLSRQGNLPQTVLNGLERIQRNANHLARMTSDLLDSSRKELGKITLYPEPLDPVAMIQNLLERLRPSLGDHTVELSPPETAEPIPPILADPKRIEQVFENLLENAVKYSPPGTPIRISFSADAAGVSVSIHNEGPGIPKGELPRLFNRFYQTERARKRGSGMGLGLSIVKGLVEAHCGKVEVESRRGRGAKFTVWLPRPAAPGKKAA